ncbi:hypothetical protein BMJ35_23975 [Sinorhizobium medicae]|nr:hypothetical protein BMJ35_23975 [Sinorhizobium medicae]
MPAARPGKRIAGPRSFFFPHFLCSSQKSSSAASAAREEFFQPKDLVWLATVFVRWFVGRLFCP